MTRDGNAGNCPLGSRNIGEVYANNDDFAFPSSVNRLTFSGRFWPVGTVRSQGWI